MKKNKKIFIYTKNNDLSFKTGHQLSEKLVDAGFTVLEKYSEKADMIICVGGDGTFLHMLMTCDYPTVPVAGVNTGHLGFFQEFMPSDLDKLVELCGSENYYIQKNSLLKAVLCADGEVKEYMALNDIGLTRGTGSVVHLDLTIGSSPIEKFSGDGILVSTAAGSTAYSYSLGGSIVDPRVNMLQITPMAPMNSSAFRSFTSSILLPPDMEVGVFPDLKYNSNLLLMVDGAEYRFDKIESVKIGYSGREVSLVRLEDYDFWGKVKSKFL